MTKINMTKEHEYAWGRVSDLMDEGLNAGPDNDNEADLDFFASMGNTRYWNSNR